MDLKAGKEYTFVLETQNYSAGALRVLLYWKTPEIFAKEKITEQREQARKVYLPAQLPWYDFWTGEKIKGGQIITAAAPIDKIPLFVKAGSIIPMGPFVEYASEKPADPIELRIYTGADGNFTLYEDETDNYNYEQGAFSTITFRWDDTARKLEIGKHRGSFPGMILERDFKVVIVQVGKGCGIDSPIYPDKVIHYRGEEITEQF